MNFVSENLNEIRRKQNSLFLDGPVICYTCMAKQMGQTSGKETIAFLTKEVQVQQRSKFRGYDSELFPA